MSCREVLLESHNTTRHDGGVALQLPDELGTVVALASERVSRKKHDGDSSIAYDYLRSRFSGNNWVFGGDGDYFSSEYRKHQDLHHHLGHASGAFFSSGFDSAAVVVIDGQGPYVKKGEYASTSIWKGHGKDINMLSINPETEYSTQSIGLVYSAITYYLGFGFLEEGKTMGLAPYGKRSSLYDNLKKWILVEGDGLYRVDPNFIEALFYLGDGKEYFHWENRQPSLRTQEIMPTILHQFGNPRRKREKISKRDMDLAWAAQAMLDEIVLSVMERAKVLTGSDNLCFAGGVALNSVTNRRIIESEMFNKAFILPAAGDDGQALGRLLYRSHQNGAQSDSTHKYEMEDVYLGPKYEDEEIQDVLRKYKDEVIFQHLDEDDLVEKTARSIASGKVLGWWQGRSELGPRALGNRSILADPRNPEMKDYINFRVKHREWFRPLAPSVGIDSVNDYFMTNIPLPYMLVVAETRQNKRDQIPAVVHVDGTARVQTVTQTQNPIYYGLIKRFENITGVPVILNTSFNDAGEPLVESPKDSLKTFLRMNLDHLVIENFFVTKKN
jgi:carbamoyltransferase